MRGERSCTIVEEFFSNFPNSFTGFSSLSVGGTAGELFTKSL